MPEGILAPRNNAVAAMRRRPVKTIMAKASTDEKEDADLDDAEASEEDRDEAESSEEEDAAAEERSSDEDSAGEEKPEPGSASLAKREPSTGAEEEDEEDEEEEDAAAQLGTQRYVLAAFFAGGIVVAYVLGKAIHSLWAWAANKDWFHNLVPALAAVTDDDKSTYATVVGAVIAIALLIRTYRKASVREWADEVATELAKVKWPTRKEVSNSTMVVIAAGAVATIYLALLDRLWSFITDLLYGTGS
jgi:preprotein translocase subunit SecE